MKKIIASLGVLVALFLVYRANAIVAPVGPPSDGTALSGMCSDGNIVRCTGYYGNPQLVNSNWLQENGTGLGISGTNGGAITAKSSLDVGGNAAFGVYGGSVAAPSNGLVVSGIVGLGTNSPANAELSVLSPNVSSTGTVINMPASPLADVLDLQVNGSSVTSFGPQGMWLPKTYSRVQVDTLVPDRVGAVIMLNNYNSTSSWVLCVATGMAASQFQVLNSTIIVNGILANGCGTNR